MVLTKAGLKLQRLSLLHSQNDKLCQGILEHTLMKSLFPLTSQGPWGVELSEGKATSSQGKCIQAERGRGFTSFSHATHCSWTLML